jgi:hypothetical protein
MTCNAASTICSSVSAGGLLEPTEFLACALERLVLAIAVSVQLLADLALQRNLAASIG